MELTLIASENANILHLKGDLDTPSSMKIQDEINRIAEIKDKNLVIDCSELNYIASAGLRLFLLLRKAYLANKLEVTLAKVKPTVMTVLKVTNFDKIFTITE